MVRYTNGLVMWLVMMHTLVAAVARTSTSCTWVTLLHISLLRMVVDIPPQTSYSLSHTHHHVSFVTSYSLSHTPPCFIRYIIFSLSHTHHHVSFVTSYSLSQTPPCFIRYPFHTFFSKGCSYKRKCARRTPPQTILAACLPALPTLQ